VIESPGSHKSESAASDSAILKQAFVVLIVKFWLTQAALYPTVMRTSGEVFCAVPFSLSNHPFTLTPKLVWYSISRGVSSLWSTGKAEGFKLRGGRWLQFYKILLQFLQLLGVREHRVGAERRRSHRHGRPVVSI